MTVKQLQGQVKEEALAPGVGRGGLAPETPMFWQRLGALAGRPVSWEARQR